jgi:RNA polymerase-binding protein
MSELAMRGTRIGAVSLERDDAVEPAERMIAQYRCPLGHVTSVPFSVEAEALPTTWGCRCGAEAEPVVWLAQMVEPEARTERPGRTHWDMLLERRTIADLEELLAERLALLHGGALAKSA